MTGKIQFKIAHRVNKTQPTVADVHQPTALGNQRARGRAKDFLTTITEIAGGARIVQLPAAEAAPVGKKKDGMVTFTFIRHGTTRMNNQDDTSQDRIRGWTNVPLNEDGVKDAEKAGKKLEGSGIKVIVHSDLDRSAQTAKIVNKEGELGATLVSTPKLRPWNLGKYTAKPTSEVMSEIAAYILEKPDEPVPDGESFNDFRARCFAGFQYALKRANGRSFAVVAHHRNERLMTSWDKAGQPADHSIDLDEFVKKGDAPGGIVEYEINPRRLNGKQDDDHAVASGDGGADVDAIEDEDKVGKIYDSNTDLPDNVRDVLPDHAQTVYRRVFNDRMKAGAGEDSARRQAWTAVKNGWRKTESGEWVRKFALDDESLIVFTAQQIELAKQLPSSAIQGPGAPDPNNASLQLFPLDADPAWAKTPFPWDQNALGKVKPEQMKPLLGALTNQDALPVKIVHMKTCVALQDRVSPDKVQAMVDDEPDDLPVVARFNGRNLIIDGHHRATARVLMGRKTMQVHFINLDDPGAEAKEDDQEIGDGAKKRWRTFLDSLMKMVSKAGPEDEPRDERGRWTGGSSGGKAGSAEFGRRIQALANELSTPPFSRKTSIAQIYDAYGRKYPDAGRMAEFKDRLMEANANEHIRLYPLDEPQAMESELRDRSMIDTGRGRTRFYFVGRTNKRDDEFSRAFEIKKIDEDQHLVFGWASVWTAGGEYVVDKQDDIIPPDEGEKAAYDFVLNSRSQGDMHERMGVGRCVESMVFTKQKQDALGVDLGMEGWWIGFFVDCPETWSLIKSGARPEFSVGGKATREIA